MSKNYGSYNPILTFINKIKINNNLFYTIIH